MLIHLIFQTVLDQGGLAPGGLNFDCKVRRESTNLKDMFVSHIGAMDSFARGLKIAAKIKEEGVMAKHVKVVHGVFTKLAATSIILSNFISKLQTP